MMFILASGVPFGEHRRIRECAPRHVERAPPPVLAGEGGRGALLPAPADSRGGRPCDRDLTQTAAASVRAVWRLVSRGPVRTADVSGRAAAGAAARDPGQRHRAAGGLSPLLALRERVPPPLRPLAGHVPRACAATRAGAGGKEFSYAWTRGLASATAGGVAAPASAGSSDSAPGSVTRISVPPPGALSAATVPPCW